MTARIAMLTFNPSEPETGRQDLQTRMIELAERCLHSNPYQAMKNVSCDYHDGVLVLRGCLPTYYLKQLAQQVVVGLEGVERIDNRIQVVTPAVLSRKG
jgi:osmotically-inducible protein OsmY